MSISWFNSCLLCVIFQFYYLVYLSTGLGCRIDIHDFVLVITLDSLSLVWAAHIKPQHSKPNSLRMTFFHPYSPTCTKTYRWYLLTVTYIMTCTGFVFGLGIIHWVCGYSTPPFICSRCECYGWLQSRILSYDSVRWYLQVWSYVIPYEAYM